MILDSNILIGVLAILVLILIADVFLLRKKVKKLLRNDKNESLEESIVSINDGIKKVEIFKGEMESYLKNIEKRIRRSTQAAETIRFNAFKGAGEGGNQSFATAFINEDGDGTVFSSLYSRDRMSVFAKPLKKFTSDTPLSEEEQQTIKLAQEKLVSKTSGR